MRAINEVFFGVVVLLLSLPAVFASWGYTDTGSNYVIDTGSNLVFSVSKTNGDINSIKYYGTEYEGWPTGQHSHVQSGLGTSTVTITQYSNVIKVEIKYLTLKHYVIARYKYDNIFLLTNKGDSTVPAQRFILRLKGGILPSTSATSDYYDTGSTIIEASDIMVNSLGYTKSKHYEGSNYGRVIDYDYVGKSTGSLGIWLIRSNHEKASGGPFFRSLLRRADATSEDLYEILNYDMGHTDPERFGLQGPYVLEFTTGATPSTKWFARNADWSWMDSLSITGWVASTGRGYVSGIGVSNMKSGFTYVAGLSNSNAQYWTTITTTSGSFTIGNVLPGTYTLTIYKNEYEVGTK
ncbi:hypothetical protein HK096_008325, partial [Nowakowskiella sp. JEL0078]